MKKILIVLGVAAIGISSCKQFKKGEGDMMYKIHEDKSGETIKEGDFIAFKLTEKTEEDSVLYSSYDYDRPTLLQQQKSAFKGDIYAALGMLSEGDSATFKINLDSMVAKMNSPKPANTKGKYLIFNMKVEKVIPKGKLNDSLFRAKVEVYLKADADLAKGKEAAKVTAYIASKSLKPTVSPSGLNYIIANAGSGVKPGVGDTALVNYTGRFLSGKVFDTSVKEIAQKEGSYNAQRPYEPIKMPVGIGASVPGFDEGLTLLSKGGKITLIMPSKLAYGEQGNQGIQPFTPLIFEIEMVNVIPGKPGAAPAMPMMPPTAPAVR
jgi:FKBP-type peptidyl-prolyl cis-trans isomerase